MTRAVHQFVATFEPGAIGNELLEAQRALQEAGFRSEIFAEFVRDPYSGKGHVYTEYGVNVPNDEDDIVIYHMAIGSVVADWLLDRNETLVLRHHNITPVEFYSPWPGANTYGMAWGRQQLARLAPRAYMGIAASTFNQSELDDLGFVRTTVAPVLFDYAAFSLPKPAQTPTSLVAPFDWLFVGWIAPHKCQHDVIRAFGAYRAMYAPSARLHLVGRTGLESYESACRNVATDLGLDDAVVFHGRVDDETLGALYRNAGVLVCMSEHEGVGLPLLEAMENNLPVVAYHAAAVPETVGDAGIVLGRKTPAVVAAAAHRVIADSKLRSELIRRGTQNVKRYALSVGTRAFVGAIARIPEHKRDRVVEQ